MFEVTAFSLPSKGNRRRKPRTGLLIPLSNRCRSEQDLNLQFLSCDRRVYRSNRSLTASDEAQHGSRAARRWARQRRGAKPRASASQKVSREKTGEAPLEPFLRPTRVRCRRSFSQPNLPLGAGINGITALEAKYLHLHCPERLSQEKTEQGETCSTSELPPGNCSGGPDSNRRPRACHAK